MNKIDYHLHTTWCNHADYSIEEVIIIMIEKKYKKIAITEHIPFQNNPRKDRMNFKNINKFLNLLCLLKKKYSKLIEIKVGFECEYLKNELNYYKNLKKDKRVDFLMLGHHFSDKKINYFLVQNENEVIDYFYELSKAIETKLFLYIAHPDIILSNYFMTNKIECCINEFFKTYHDKIVFEVNCSGFLNKSKHYPNDEFWNIASRYKIKVCVNSDSHNKQDFLNDNISLGIAYAKERNLKIIDLFE